MHPTRRMQPKHLILPHLSRTPSTVSPLPNTSTPNSSPVNLPPSPLTRIRQLVRRDPHCRTIDCMQLVQFVVQRASVLVVAPGEAGEGP